MPFGLNIASRALRVGTAMAILYRQGYLPPLPRVNFMTVLEKRQIQKNKAQNTRPTAPRNQQTISEW